MLSMQIRHTRTKLISTISNRLRQPHNRKRSNFTTIRQEGLLKIGSLARNSRVVGFVNLVVATIQSMEVEKDLVRICKLIHKIA